MAAELTLIETDLAHAILCGRYATLNLSSNQRQALSRPRVLAAIRAGTRQRLELAAVEAVRVLEELTNSKLDKNDAPGAKVRLDAAKSVLDRAGYIAPRAVPPDRGADVPLHEMDVDELRRMADRLEAEIADRAKPVDAPATSDAATQVAEMLA